MSHTRAALPVIEVEKPCVADWNAMPGDQRQRFCAHCQRHVHDLSTMRSDEVADLICRNAGELCVRFARGADGQVKTLDYAPAPRRERLRRWLSLGLHGGLAAAIAAVIAGPLMQPTLGTIRRPVAPPAPAPIPAAPAGPSAPAAPAAAPEATCPTP